MSLSRFDLHLHTEYSPDCDTSLERIEAHCLAQGLTGLAVTDHNTMEGALRLRDRVKSLQVIVGEEVSTRDGDVIGLFLHTRIPPRLSALETMEAIHAQGGLVYLPHPFDRARARRDRGASISALIHHIDIVEVFNGKVGRDEYNTLAAELAQRHGKLAAGGSDAHSLRDIGSVTNSFEIMGPLTPERFLHGLAGARIVGTRRSKLSGYVVIGRRPFSLAWRRLQRKLTG
jgi:predicted metal-dependent phosphoesterase TrpH